jgi:Na+-driven multidrug efflux pump
MSVLVWFFGENLIRLFNNEPELVRMANTFLRIQIVDYLVFGVVVVLMYCLNGVGDTMVPMLTTFGTIWLIQIPLAHFLPQWTDWGVYGVRWAMVTGIVLRAVIYSIYFKGGWWKTRKV